MLVTVLSSVLLSVPPVEVERQGQAWRVIDTVVPNHPTYDCSRACTPYDYGDYIDPNRNTLTKAKEEDTACIQEAIKVGALAYQVDDFGDRVEGWITRYSGTELPAGDCYIESTLTIMNVTGFELYGVGRGPQLPYRTRLLWEGDDASPMIQLVDSQFTHLHDFEIEPDSTKTLDVAIDSNNCDELNDPCEWWDRDSPVVHYQPTQNLFERITVTAPGAYQTLKYGFTVSPVDGTNNDFHRFRDTYVVNYDEAAYVLLSGQNKSIAFDQAHCDSHRGTDSNCVRSVGCFSYTGGGGGYNSGPDFLLTATGCPTTITNANFEGSYSFLHMGPTAGEPTIDFFGVTVTGSRWAQNEVPPATPRAVVVNRTSGGLVMISNLIGDVIGDGHPPKYLSFDLDGGNSAQGDIFIGNQIVSNLEGNDLWSSDFMPEVAIGNYQIACAVDGGGDCLPQQEMKPLDLPIGTFDSEPNQVVSPGRIGPGGIIQLGSGDPINYLYADDTGSLNPHDGHRVTLYADQRRDVNASTDMKLAKGIPFKMQPGDMLSLWNLDDKWWEIGRVESKRRHWQTSSVVQLTGSISTTETTMATHTIPADMLLDNDRVHIRATYQMESDAGFASTYTPIVKWGSVQLTSSAITMASGNHFTVDSWVTIRTAGASPVWDAETKTQVSSSTSVTATHLFDQGTVVTDDPIAVVARLKFAGVPNSLDKIKLRELSVTIVRE